MDVRPGGSRRHRRVLRICGARDLLMDGGRVIGVRTGDRGVDRHGAPKPSFEPGVDIHAEGHDPGRWRARQPDASSCCGGSRSAAGRAAAGVLARHQGALGRARGPAGRAARSSTRWAIRFAQKEFGGGFIYAMSDTRVSVGFVAGSTTRIRCSIRTWRFRRFKLHPFVTRLLRGRADDPLRREGAAGKRMVRAARNAPPTARCWWATRRAS